MELVAFFSLLVDLYHTLTTLYNKCQSYKVFGIVAATHGCRVVGGGCGNLLYILVGHRVNHANGVSLGVVTLSVGTLRQCVKDVVYVGACQVDRCCRSVGVGHCKVVGVQCLVLVALQWFQWCSHGYGVGCNSQTVCHLSVCVFCFLGHQCRQVELVAHAGKSRDGAFAGGVTYCRRSWEVTVAGKQQCSCVLAVALIVVENLLQFVVLAQMNLQLRYTALDGQSLVRSYH